MKRTKMDGSGSFFTNNGLKSGETCRRHRRATRSRFSRSQYNTGTLSEGLLHCGAVSVRGHRRRVSMSRARFTVRSTSRRMKRHPRPFASRSHRSVPYFVHPGEEMAKTTVNQEADYDPAFDINLDVVGTFSHPCHPDRLANTDSIIHRVHYQKKIRWKPRTCLDKITSTD